LTVFIIDTRTVKSSRVRKMVTKESVMKQLASLEDAKKKHPDKAPLYDKMIKQTKQKRARILGL